MRNFVLFLAAFLTVRTAHAQAVDWTASVWHEPQVRYLLADVDLGGNIATYRKYATEERDPDSREAVRRYDAGVRVVNVADLERKALPYAAAKGGQIVRIVQRGSTRTISGDEVVLSTDGSFSVAKVRLVVLDLTLGRPPADYEGGAKRDAAVAEALRLFAAGGRAANARHFTAVGLGAKRALLYAGTKQPADGARVVLNADRPYFETNVRYFLADMALGGSRDFYARTAQLAHERSCEEAVARFDQGVTITNLGDFERKKVEGQTIIARKGTSMRISGFEVKLSTD